MTICRKELFEKNSEEDVSFILGAAQFHDFRSCNNSLFVLNTMLKQLYWLVSNSVMTFNFSLFVELSSPNWPRSFSELINYIQIRLPKASSFLFEEIVEAASTGMSNIYITRLVSLQKSFDISTFSKDFKQPKNSHQKRIQVYV